MAHVITQPCCNDASCVPVCPVDCIHPAPGEPGFATAEALYIDAGTCIDCGACVPACPVDAIVPDSAPTAAPFVPLAAAWYARNPLPPGIPEVIAAPARAAVTPLRVAVVGSGPAGAYAAQELLAVPNVSVSMFDRLPTPWGLVRGGVAPDHPQTKGVITGFDEMASQGRFNFYLGVEVGKHITHDEVMQSHHAVIYAYGLDKDKPLGIEGEELPGCDSARSFVNWYNGHPDFSDRDFDLSEPRVVVVGNGNVALDIARVLLTDPDVLARTEIADHALEVLRGSRVNEVVLLGRRGPAQAAYTTPELLGLASVAGLKVLTRPGETKVDPVTAGLLDDPASSPMMRAKLDALDEVQTVTRSRASRHGRSLTLRFSTTPSALLGHDRVDGLRLERMRLSLDDERRVIATGTGEQTTMMAGLVLRSTGYWGSPLDQVPFDTDRGLIPNEFGRVMQGASQVAGVYVAGWIKRGPTGGIGLNKTCAQETVGRLLADHQEGRLPDPPRSREDLARLVRRRQPDVVEREGWRSLDALERSRGEAEGRPRNKLTSTSTLYEALQHGLSRP